MAVMSALCLVLGIMGAMGSTWLTSDYSDEEQEIGLFIPVKDQKFDLKQTWGHYTDVDNYTISNFGMRSLV